MENTYPSAQESWNLIPELPKPRPRADTDLTVACVCHRLWPDLTSAASSIWRLIKDLLMMYNVCHQISHNLKGGLKSENKDEKVM